LLSDTSAGVASTQGQSSIINTSFDFDKTLNAQAKLQRDAINAALDNEFRLIDQKTDELAKTWINDPNGGIAAIINNPDAVDHIIKYDTVAIANLSTEYQKRLTDAIARSMKEVDALPAAQKEMKARAQADGFTSAGAWYGIMAQSSYLMNSLVQNVAPSIGAGATPPHDDESVWRKAYDYIQAAQETQQTPGKANAGGTAHDSSNDWWKEVKQFIGNDHNIIGQEGIANVITESSGKPVMLRLKDIADYMIDISTIIVTAIAGVMGYWNDTIVGKLGDLSGFAAGAHGVAKVWMNMVTFVLQIAIGFFLMMSIYLPMVPFIIFMGQVLNWLVTVVEGVAAAPFLAFAHFDTDGEGLGHKTQYGYTFMLQSFMRPVMLVLGFVFGAMLLEAIGGYVMVIYPTVVANVQIDSMTGLFSTIGFIALFFVIMVGLVTTCFSVTYLLPDAIFAFIGAQSSATSQTGRHETQNAEKSGLTGAGISRTVQPGLDHTGAATRQEKKAADAGVRLAMPKSGNCE
jgi:conjugal transfer/type IV secretion protein DotA/TraY